MPQLELHWNIKQRKKLLAKFEELKRLGGDADKVLNTTSKNTVNKMKREAPYDTGRLRRNIDFEHTGPGRLYIHSEAIDPEDPRKIDYAPIQEYGRGVRAQPYFRKNLRWMRKELFNALKRMINIKLSK